MVIKKTITERAGQRLDNLLFQVYKATPKSHVYRMLRKGRIRVNGKVCKTHTYRLVFGDEIMMPNPHNPQKPTPSAETISIVESMILQEEADFWLLNKRPGFCVHQSDKDVFGIIEVMQHIDEKAQLVHRLDRNTSGCLLIAKGYQALSQLQALWKQKQVVKEYSLLVHGKWSYPNQHTVKKPLLRIEDSNQVIVSQKGKEAITHFEKIKQYQNYTLLRARIETGRTHQIRVHAASIGHPIVGDQRYGKKDNLTQYLFLHAEKLVFHWKGENKVLKCDMTNEQRKCLQSLN